MKPLIYSANQPCPIRGYKRPGIDGLAMAPRPPGTTRRRSGWSESDYVQAMRRAVERLNGRFTNAQLVPELQKHEPAADVARWVNSGYIGSQVAVWRDAQEVELVEGPGRVFRVTALWKGGGRGN